MSFSYSGFALPVVVDSTRGCFLFGGFDENKGAAPRDPLHVPVGPITRARARRFKEALNGLIQDTWADSKLLKPKISPHEDQGLINVIKAMDWAE